MQNMSMALLGKGGNVMTTKIFGQDIPVKQYSVDEVKDLIRERFGADLAVGRVAYYLLAMKKKGLLKATQAQIMVIVQDTFEEQGFMTGITLQNVAFYQGRINKGLVDIEKEFGPNKRVKKPVDIDLSIFVVK